MNKIESRRIVIDCDGSPEDCHSLLLLNYLVSTKQCPPFELLGITNVAGTTSPANASINIAITLQLIQHINNNNNIYIYIYIDI